jgi:hypothetical protein
MGFGTIVFVLVMLVASILVGVLLLYRSLGGHQHGPLILLKQQDLHETFFRSATGGGTVTTADGYHPHLSIR